jgi:hypothetical protein
MPGERTDIPVRQGERSGDALKTLRELRRAARDEIDRLIAFLDESEIDPELEDDDREIDAGEEPSMIRAKAELPITRACSNSARTSTAIASALSRATASKPRSFATSARYG